MVAEAGAIPTPKFVTVTWMSLAAENPTPLLLAATLTFVVPKGQVMVDPGEVPHPPVQLSRVNGHAVGSENPNWAGETLAPAGDVPLTVSVPPPP